MKSPLLSFYSSVEIREDWSLGGVEIVVRSICFRLN